MKEFEPLIVGFVCNECVYAAADLAGTTRLTYPPNIRLIRVPCSGQVDLIHILRAFEKGADGVFVGGCLKDQCHYIDGNLKAEKRVDFIKKVLKAMGMEEERLSINFLSAAMAREFVDKANELTKTIRKLGPSPLKKQKFPSRYGNKREIFRNMLMSISDGLNAKGVEYNAVISGFGETVIDEKKCLGCGACEYVCKDRAMKVEPKKNIIQVKKTYWMCTACLKCKDACPKDCLDVKEEFDLARFLNGEEELHLEVGMVECKRCGTSFLPIMLSNEIDNMLKNKSISSSFLGLCPTCRKFDYAEKIKKVHGFIGKEKRNSEKISYIRS